MQFWFYSNEEKAIQHIAEELRNKKFEVIVIDTEADPGYVIHAFMNMIPDIGELQKLRAEFNKMARQQGAKYDGWLLKRMTRYLKTRNGLSRLYSKYVHPVVVRWIQHCYPCNELYMR